VRDLVEVGPDAFQAEDEIADADLREQ